MSTPPSPASQHPRVVVVSGGTDGMGRALTLARAARGDTVVALGSNAEKGQCLLRDAAQQDAGRVEFLRVDLSSVAATRAVIREIGARHDTVDALALFANRQAPSRVVTAEGFEQTFALYYLSRYLLSRSLGPQLRRSGSPVIVNVAGVGLTKGSVHWDDLQLAKGYSTVAAQLQAGRANDLLGVALAARPDDPTRSVLYHPGFTRSGDLSTLPAPMRFAIRTLARFGARSITESIAPIHGFIDEPPAAPLTAIDRGRSVPPTLHTLDPADAQRLMRATENLVGRE